MTRSPFSPKVQDQCWEKTMKMLGRDPSRWRYDAAGTPVMKDLYGKTGLCGWQYDHIIPTKNDGGADISYCQVLQTQANKRKSAKELDNEGLHCVSPNIQMTEAELDFAEMIVHGNVKDDMGNTKCVCISKDQAVPGFKRRDKTPACEIPERCSKTETCKELEMKLKSMLHKQDTFSTAQDAVLLSSPHACDLLSCLRACRKRCGPPGTRRLPKTA